MDRRVDITYVWTDTIFDDGEEPRLGIVVATEYRASRSSKEHVMVFDRGTLVELITEIAYRGAAADRELPSELAGAVAAGVEKHRREASRA
jgi:hypothetical protein